MVWWAALGAAGGGTAAAAGATAGTAAAVGTGTAVAGTAAATGGFTKAIGAAQQGSGLLTMFKKKKKGISGLPGGGTADPRPRSYRFGG